MSLRQLLPRAKKILHLPPHKITFNLWRVLSKSRTGLTQGACNGPRLLQTCCKANLCQPEEHWAESGSSLSPAARRRGWGEPPHTGWARPAQVLFRVGEGGRGRGRVERGGLSYGWGRPEWEEESGSSCYTKLAELAVYWYAMRIRLDHLWITDFPTARLSYSNPWKSYMVNMFPSTLPMHLCLRN